MKPLCFLAFLGIVLLGGSCKNETTSTTTSALEQRADALFQDALDSAQIAGGALMVFQDGEELVNKAYGMASLELSAPMPEQPQFEIGSVTKQFTAAAILRLVEDGKLALEDDFTDYLAFDTQGRKVTIGNLLNHTSGIASYTDLEEFGQLVIQELPKDSLVRLVETKPFNFEPNEALIYNNSAYFFLGLIIESVSGQAYEEFLKEEFFKPLGMQNTNYCSTSRVVKNKVYGYSYTPEGLVQKPYLDHTWPYAAGSLCSTTEDLLIWMRALHGGKVFSKAQYSQMITPQTLKDGTPVNYAMGLNNFSNFGHQQIAHGGGINGFLSDTRYLPEEDLYIICLINTTGPKGGSFFAEQMTWEILEKQAYPAVVMQGDFSEIEGVYSGPVRGDYVSIEVKAFDGGISYVEVGEQDADTLNLYVGDHTWMDDNDRITVKDGQWRHNGIYNFYILSKED